MRAFAPGKQAAIARSALAAGLAVAWGALVLHPGTGLGASPTTSYPPTRVASPAPQPEGRWAERAVAAGDISGDGVPDLFVSAPGTDAERGRVYLVSGASRATLYAIDSPEPQAGARFGFFVSVPGDLTGDGKPEVAVGTDSQDVPTSALATCGLSEPNSCNEDQGKAWVFNGATGALLPGAQGTLDNPQPQVHGRFGSRIGRAGDLTGDGRSELIVGASNNDVPQGCGTDGTIETGCHKDQGQAFVFDGTTGALLPGARGTLNLPAADQAATCSASCGSFGLAVQGPGDTNGDGVTDQLVSAPSHGSGKGRMYLFSGADGALLRSLDSPQPELNALFGFQDAAPLSPGDVNADGHADVYGNGFSKDGPVGPDQGRAWVFDGKTGGLLHTLDDPAPTAGGQFGWSLARTDYDRDGRPDLYIGQSPHHLGGAPAAGGSYVFRGGDGSLLKALELPAADDQASTVGNLGPNLGWTVAAPGDLNADGEPDFVAGAPYLDVDTGSGSGCGQAEPNDCNENQGLLYLFMSTGTSRPGGGTGQGNPPPMAVPARCRGRAALARTGTAAGERLIGSALPDAIAAGGGDDVVDGLGGDDCIDLGSGTDRGQGGAGDDLVAGGPGADRVSGSSGDDSLRGGSGNDRLFGGRGNDGLVGDGGNDRLSGSFGNDRLSGADGRDRLSGSRGRDRLSGGRGGDRISGGSSGDRIRGDQGGDRINGNSGGDRIAGGSGNDRLNGSSGRDRIVGGSGNDRISARDGRRDRISCGSGRDLVVADAHDRVARDCERVLRRGGRA